MVKAGEDKKMSFSYEELTNMQGMELHGKYIVIEKVGPATRTTNQSKEEELISCNNLDTERNGIPYELRIATSSPELKYTLMVRAIQKGRERDPININRDSHTTWFAGNELFFMQLSSCFEGGKPYGFLFVLKQTKRKRLGPYVLSL